jgi:cobalt-zinc-cadmium efflux system membrane fusion protein
MKLIYIPFLLSLILLESCKNNPTETKLADIQPTDSLMKSGPVDAIVTLTDEQIKAIGLKTGNIESRNLKTTLKVNGRLTLPPQNQAQVSVLISGIVRNIAVTEGQFVNKGQVLATLVNSEVIQLQQDYLENKSQLVYLQQEYDRQKTLQEENINAAKTYQQVQNELSVAEAKQKGIKEKLQLYGINTRKISTSNFQNQITVVAPISGYIHHVNLTMGKFADANSILFDIVDNRFLHLDLTVFEKDIHKIKAGQKLTFTDANDKTHIHPATIFALNKAFEINEQAIIVHAKIDEKTEAILPGMYVEARIQIDDNKAAALPDEAIVSNGDDHFIYLEVKKDQFKQIGVSTGASDMGYTEIIPLEEIPANAKIVIKGAYYLLSQLTKGEGDHSE